jgi:hypothetical protein
MGPVPAPRGSFADLSQQLRELEGPYADACLSGRKMRRRSEELVERIRRAPAYRDGRQVLKVRERK